MIEDFGGTKPFLCVFWHTAAATGRDCHGFRNTCGLRVGVGTGTGTGWHFEPPTKPAPVAGVVRFVEGSLSAFFLKKITTCT